MSVYKATVAWTAEGPDFSAGHYSRGHAWIFDGGVTVPASSSPDNVPLPWSVEKAIDPEEALVAAASSCHMLFFLNYAAKAGFVVARYTDHAEGVMAKNAQGRMAMTRITLRPLIEFTGAHPSDTALDDLHHHAHESCFIANSLLTEIVVERV